MVSLAGAQACPPLVSQITSLTATIAAFNTALAQNGQVWQVKVDYYDNSQQSHTLIVQNNYNASDSQTILNYLKNTLTTALATVNAQLTAVT